MAGTVNWLFVDLNSYFASVEQELVPGTARPAIVIVPIEAENALLHRCQLPGEGVWDQDWLQPPERQDRVSSSFGRPSASTALCRISPQDHRSY